MLHNHLVRMQPSHVLEASCHDTTRRGNWNWEQATLKCHAYPRPKSQTKSVYHTDTKPQSGHWGSRPGPTHYYRVSADSRYRLLRAGICLHIHKLKPQASIKNKIEKFHKLFDVYNTVVYLSSYIFTPFRYKVNKSLYLRFLNLFQKYPILTINPIANNQKWILK